MRSMAILFFFMGLMGPSAVTATENTYSPAFPDPERFAGDIAAFVAADSTDFPAAGGLLCIGSSSMRMWHPRIAQDLAPRRVIPRGFGGSTIYDVMYYCDQIVLPYRPAAILLYEGDNDIDFGVTPNDFINAFDDFVRLVRTELPHVHFYVMSIKPGGLRWAKWPAMLEANKLLAERCSADPLMDYIEVGLPLLGEDGLPDDSFFLPDRLHLNDKGYDVWAKAVNAVVPRD